MPRPTLIYCAAGNKRFAQIAIDAKFIYGAKLPATVYFQPDFVDNEFKKPRHVPYINALRKWQPSMASVLDIEEWRRLDEYLLRAEDVAKYCKTVMLIPKVPGIIKELPETILGKPVRLAYSVPSGYSKTEVEIKEFGNRTVHLLGGSPMKQLELTKEMNVVSVDGNYAQKLAHFCQFFYPEILWTENYREIIVKDREEKAKDRKIKNPIWPTLLEFDGKKWGDGSNTANAPYEAFRRSCENIMRMWDENDITP